MQPGIELNMKGIRHMAAKYKQLAARLTDLISANLHNGIHRLPTEAELCRQYQVSRQTVRQALSLLSAQGLITTRQGSGSYATGLSEDGLGNTIALLIRNEQEHIYPELVDDIRTILANKSYTLSVYSTKDQVSREREILEELLQDIPRGIIAEPCKSALPNPNLNCYEKFRKLERPLVFLHNSYTALPWAICIKNDDYYGGYLLGQHLSAQGHTRVAGLFKIDDMQGVERYHGFQSFMRDTGYMVPDYRIGWYTSAELDRLEDKQDTRFLSEFIHRQLSDCSALICQNDEIAYWMIKELSYAGLEVPQDITVVCFTDSYLSELSHVRITTLAHKPHETARRTADCMLRSLQRLPAASQEIPWELIVRESDAALHS